MYSFLVCISSFFEVFFLFVKNLQLLHVFLIRAFKNERVVATVTMQMPSGELYIFLVFGFLFVSRVKFSDVIGWDSVSFFKRIERFSYCSFSVNEGKS